VSDRLIRHLEDIDFVRERAAMTHEELLSRVSEQLNERIYVLSFRVKQAWLAGLDRHLSPDVF
jgi:Mg2+ and Co2+ transporter CorA